MDDTQESIKRTRADLGVLIYNSQGELLLGKRVSSHNAHTWAPVGGHIEFGETFEECALREAWEEAGLVPQNLQFLGATNDFFEAEQKHYVSIFMKAVLPEGAVPEVREPSKTSCWQWFDVNNLPTPLFLSLQKVMDGNVYTGV